VSGFKITHEGGGRVGAVAFRLKVLVFFRVGGMRSGGGVVRSSGCWKSPGGEDH